jgi:hypothetical protein
MNPVSWSGPQKGSGGKKMGSNQEDIRKTLKRLD